MKFLVRWGEVTNASKGDVAICNGVSDCPRTLPMIVWVNHPPFGGYDAGVGGVTDLDQVNALGRAQRRDKTALPSL